MIDFRLHLSQAHTKSYFEFKCKINENFIAIKNYLKIENDSEKIIQLLSFALEQAKFINKNLFSASLNEIEQFENSFFPIEEKINHLLNKSVYPKI